jgi:hypothetical protein
MVFSNNLLFAAAAAASTSLTIVSGTVNVSAVTSAQDLHFEIWSNSGSSPVAQIGADSETINVSSTGEKTLNFTTPVDITGVATFWLVPVVSGGDVNYLRNGSVAGTDVDGGSFIYNTTITNLTLGTTFVPRMSVLLSDGRRVGNRDTGSVAVGLGGGGQAGLRITLS